jgi:hypothetical protein
MVDGLASFVGCLRSLEDKKVTHEELQAVQGDVGAQEIQRTTGGQRGIPAPRVLRASVHVCLDGGSNQGAQQQEQPPPISKAGQGIVPGVSAGSQFYAAVRASPRREPDEQSGVEPDDVVRLLSSSLALAELHGDRTTAEALHALRDAIYSAGTLCHPSDAPEKVWASIGDEAKGGIRVALAAARWRLIDTQPLATRTPNRVGRLRAYGNAIVAPQAVAFVKAVMACLENP